MEVVAPPLRQPHPLSPGLAAVIDAANRIAVTVRQSPFNCVRVPEAAFIQHGGGGCPQPMRGDLILGEAHPAKGGIQCVDPEEHTSELQSLMRISYAVFCL